jgi:hypothetical protein
LQNSTTSVNAWQLKEAVVLFTETPKNDRLAKSIYRGGCFIYKGGWEIPASVNGFMEGGHLKTTASKNDIFSKAVPLRCPPL